MTHVVPPPSEHGGDAAVVASSLGITVDDLLDLSVSLNPVAADPVPIVARHADAVRTYPDRRDATRALAAAMDVDEHRLLLTNGASEAIALVASELDRGWADRIDFSLYRRHLRVLDPKGPSIRSNPNNPTGRLAGIDDQASVWDESFYPLATGTWSRCDTDAIVIGSLTKLLACPGLRIGYVIAPDDVLATTLARRQPEWPLNGIACRALPELIETIRLPEWAASIAALRDALVTVLASAGLSPEPSDANYVLCASASGLRSRLAPHGVLVRDCASFGLRDHARVAVPDEAGLDRLTAALRAAGYRVR